MVCEIEAKNSAEANPLDGAWTEADFRSVLKSADYAGLLAFCDKRVVGFAVYQLTAKAINIITMSVDPAFERQGVGTALADSLKAKLNRKRKVLAVSVREHRLGAQLFLQRLGFRAVDVVRDWFEAPVREDAIKFHYTPE